MPKPKANETNNKTPERKTLRARSPGRPSKNEASEKSPRKRSPGRPRSNKSPTRVTVKKAELSPPRQSSTPLALSPRSPINATSLRRSPPRKAKEVASNAVVKLRRTVLESDSESDSESKSKSSSSRSKRSEVTDVTESEGGSSILRRLTRSSQQKEMERVVHLKHLDNINARKIGEFSDEDEILKVETIQVPSNVKQFTEFGGLIGTLFLTVSSLPAMFALWIFCNENQCSFTHVPNMSKYYKLSTYFDGFTYLGFIGYATLAALVSITPICGKRVPAQPSVQPKFVYIMNGLFLCILLLAIQFGLELAGIPVCAFLIDHMFHLLCVSSLFGLFLTVYAFIRSYYVPLSALNIHVLGKSPIYGFFMGREVSPRVFGLLDLKMYVLRLGIIGPLLIDFAYLYQSISYHTGAKDAADESYLDIVKNIHIQTTLLLLTLIHSAYFVGTLIVEKSWVTSFEIQYEGFGIMGGLGYLIYPFMVNSVTQYIYHYDINLPWWQLCLIAIVNIIGTIFFFGANKQKDTFRKNPYDPAVAHLETIPTTKGKKLLCSGFWGIVRHPNYLGDILINLSFAPFCLCVPPVLTSLSIVVLLVHRSVRDNARCKEKYGSAWDRYCRRVKYVLIPKVY